MGNKITRTVLFAASALLSMSAFGAGAARFGTLRNSDWVVTNAWQAVSNKTHDLILEIGQGDSLPPDWQNVSNAAMNAVQSLQPAYDYTDNSLISFSSTGSVFRSLSYGTPTRWTDATGCVWEVGYVYEDDWVADSSRISNVSWISAGYEDAPELWSIYFTFDSSTDMQIYTFPPGQTQTNFFISASEWSSFYDGAFDFNIYRSPHESTNLIGRVALTNDISQAISTNNEAFVSAVLAAPLVGADPNDLSELAEYGSYGTVGAAILALIAGLAALKRRMTSAETALAQKASLTDLPYALVEPGEWEFSGLPSGATNVQMSFDDVDGWMIFFNIAGGSRNTSTGQGTAEDLVVVFEFPGEYGDITATRASLPGHLLDRAVNEVPVSTDTELTLPAIVNAGKARDFLVRLAISGSTVPTITFAAPTGETIAYETDGDEFPVPDEAGTWFYSFTETAAHKFAVSLKQLQSVSQPTQGGS